MPDSQTLVNRVNQLPYPPTIYSHGWIYGLWYCGTAFQKSKYWGQFPATFVKRIKTMFPTERLLHLCCGRCAIQGAVNVDNRSLPEVNILADAESLPFRSNTFDVVLIDPPYSEEAAASRYHQKRLIRSTLVIREVRRILVRNGWLLWLDEKYPSYWRKEWQLKGLIGVVTGFERRMRVLSMFQVQFK